MEEVWAAFADLPSWKSSNPYLPRLEGDLRVGSRPVLTASTANGKSGSAPVLIVDVEAPRLLRWTSSWLVRGLFDADHRFELSSAGASATDFVQREVLSGLVLALAPGIARDFEARCTRLAEALKVHVEAAGPRFRARELRQGVRRHRHRAEMNGGGNDYSGSVVSGSAGPAALVSPRSQPSGSPTNVGRELRTSV